MLPEEKFIKDYLKEHGIYSVPEIMAAYAKFKVVEELKNHIEHPTKPGYRRHDILNRIKEIENGKC